MGWSGGAGDRRNVAPAQADLVELSVDPQLLTPALAHAAEGRDQTAKGRPGRWRSDRARRCPWPAGGCARVECRCRPAGSERAPGLRLAVLPDQPARRRSDAVAQSAPGAGQAPRRALPTAAFWRARHAGAPGGRAAYRIRTKTCCGMDGLSSHPVLQVVGRDHSRSQWRCASTANLRGGPAAHNRYCCNAVLQEGAHAASTSLQREAQPSSGPATAKSWSAPAAAGLSPRSMRVNGRSGAKPASISRCRNTL